MKNLSEVTTKNREILGVRLYYKLTKMTTMHVAIWSIIHPIRQRIEELIETSKKDLEP